MSRENVVACSLALLSIGAVGCTSQPAAPSSVPGSAATAASTDARGGRPVAPPTVYVASQGLYYDSFVATDPLPMKGRFQQIGPTEFGAATECGPGNPGYLGGRWWEDLNGNDIQDEGDHFFLLSAAAARASDAVGAVRLVCRSGKCPDDDLVAAVLLREVQELVGMFLRDVWCWEPA